jgi:U3 small nucleolar RNA-associated protein 20
MPPDVEEVVKRCLQGEEVKLDVQGVRERVLRIGRVPQIVRDDDIQPLQFGADISTRWLIGMSYFHLY